MQKETKGMEKALITGGTGFLGDAIAKELEARDVEVVTFDLSYANKSGRPHFRGSILDIDDLNAAVQGGVSMVFHIAGVLGTSELMQQSGHAVDVNVRGTVNVLEVCRSHGISRIFYPTKPNEWLNTYSITKKAGEDFVRMYEAEFGLEARILRWLNAYGPGQKLQPVRKAVPVMILQAVHNLPVQIWGDGKQPVDLIYTDDLARVTVEYTLHDTDGLVRDTGCTHRLSVNELAEAIVRLSRSSSEIVHLEMRQGEDPSKHVAPLVGSTAADILDLEKTKVPLEDGLLKTIAYYRGLTARAKESAINFYGLRQDSMALAA